MTNSKQGINFWYPTISILLLLIIGAFLPMLSTYWMIVPLIAFFVLVGFSIIIALYGFTNKKKSFGFSGLINLILSIVFLVSFGLPGLRNANLHLITLLISVIANIYFIFRRN
jgi:hypothetical protein